MVVAAVNVVSVLCCFAVGLLVQCSVVTTAQHEERKRQRRMRRGKRQDRGAGLGGEDDDDGSSSASSASSDGGDGDRSRPLVRGLDAEDFKRYTDVRGSHMPCFPVVPTYSLSVPPRCHSVPRHPIGLGRTASGEVAWLLGTARALCVCVCVRVCVCVCVCVFAHMVSPRVSAQHAGCFQSLRR